MHPEHRADLFASLGRSFLATGAGAALGLFAWMVLVVGETEHWEGHGLFAAGVGLAAGLGMSRQPLLGGALAAMLSIVPVIAFDFPFLIVLPAMMVAGGAMLAWVSTQPLRRGFHPRPAPRTSGASRSAGSTESDKGHPLSPRLLFR